MMKKIRDIVLDLRDSILDLSSFIIISLFFISGIGRYRFVLIYALFLFLRSIYSITNSNKRPIYLIFLPSMVAAVYYDIVSGPFFPIYEKNYFILSFAAMIFFDSAFRFIAERLIKRVTCGRLFAGCPSCKYNNKKLVVKCLYCGYSKDVMSEDISASTQTEKKELSKDHKTTINNLKIKPKVLRMLGLNNGEQVQYSLKLFPFKSFFKNGIRQIRTDFVVTGERIIFLDYLYFSSEWREKDVILISNITDVNGKMKKFNLSHEPLIEIITIENDIYEIVFKKYGSYRTIIMEIGNIIRQLNKNVNVKFEFFEN